VVVPPGPVRVPSLGLLALSVTSVSLVAYDKGDNEMMSGLCTDLLAFALQLKKYQGNPQQGYRLMKVL
jgi:hypothetical protein